MRREYNVLSARLKWLALAAGLAAYICLPGVRWFAASALGFLQERDLYGLRRFVLSFGLWAPAASILLMSAQSLLPFVPGLALTVANAWIFGWQYGALYSWLGALAGAALDFGVARWYGRPAMLKMVRASWRERLDAFIRRHGVFAVFITRIVPVVPFKVVSYSAGLADISPRRYLAATALGQTPGILLYSLLGGRLLTDYKMAAAATAGLLLAGLSLYCLRGRLERYFCGE